MSEETILTPRPCRKKLTDMCGSVGIDLEGKSTKDIFDALVAKVDTMSKATKGDAPKAAEPEAKAAEAQAAGTGSMKFPGLNKFRKKSQEDAPEELSEKHLHSRVRWNKREDIETLLTNGADINKIDQHGNTALHIAVQNGHEDLAKYFVEKHNAEVSIPNGTKTTALHMAYMYGYMELIEFLISKGADQTIVNEEGKTPVQCTPPEESPAA